MSSEHKGGHGHAKKHEEHEEHEEHVNHEAWVIPYADLLTLLLAMFLALWAAGAADKAKTEALAQAFRETIGISIIGSGSGNNDSILDGGTGTGSGSAIDPGVLKEMQAKALEEKQARQAAQATENKQLEDVEDRIQAAADAAGLGQAISFRREERGLAVTIVSDEVLFPAGDAELLGPGLRILDGIVPALKASGKPILIEGHTDPRPISTSRYPSNWELSTARATRVLRYLQTQHDFPVDRLSAAGYSYTKPIAAGTSAEAYARNRRVEIVILSTVK